MSVKANMRKFCAKAIIFYILFVQVSARVKGRDFGSMAGKWKIKYGINEDKRDLVVDACAHSLLSLEIYDIDWHLAQAHEMFFEFATADPKIATVEKQINASDISGSAWQGMVAIKGHHFGYTHLFLTLNDPQANENEISDEILEIKVMRTQRVDIQIFIYSAAAIMLLMFINLGTVLDLERMRLIFLFPVGPLLGFCTRYIIMPALALGLGALVFPADTNLQLALLFCAVAPSGGMANICNVFLKGNINLSLAITTVNSILALGMLPLWIYLMGPVLYPSTNFDLPFANLVIGCIGLVVALVLGVSLRTFIPKTTRIIFRFLKPVSVFLSLCLVAVTVGINAFAFKEITAMIFLAALFLPVLGYLLTFILGKLMRRTATDAMTIAVETSIINMSLPIVLLEYTVAQPMNDMLVVVPILTALMSLFLVVVFYTVRRIFGWNVKLDTEAFDEETFLVD